MHGENNIKYVLMFKLATFILRYLIFFKIKPSPSRNTTHELKVSGSYECKHERIIYPGTRE
jgi:hypothetical protein